MSGAGSKSRTLLGLALTLGIAGPVVVLIALASAGGSNRPRPHFGFPTTYPGTDRLVEGSCEVPLCEQFPAELANEYRAAWIGLGIGIAGALLVLALVGRRASSRGTMYASLGAVGGVATLSAVSIGLSSIEVCFTSLGCSPRPRDTFESVGIVLFLGGLALVPAGALLRKWRA